MLILFATNITEYHVNGDRVSQWFVKHGPAAEHMLAFDRVLERAMFDKKTDGFHAGHRLWESGPEEVYTAEVEQAATRHIRSAAKATDAPEILARIRQEQQILHGVRKLLAACRGQPFEEGAAD